MKKFQFLEKIFFIEFAQLVEFAPSYIKTNKAQILILMDFSVSELKAEPESAQQADGDKHDHSSKKLWRGKKQVYEKIQGKLIVLRDLFEVI